MSDQQRLDPKVIERLRKLLRLARDGGATEGEAGNALTLAHKIAQEHNLSIATIEASGGQATEAGRRQEGTVRGFAMYKWQRDLMDTIAEVNYCYCEVNEVHERMSQNPDKDEYDRWVWRKRGYRLIGREANVASVTVMFEYLNETIKKLSMDFVNGDSQQRLSRRSVAFQEGCGDRLRERLAMRHMEYLAEQKREARERNAAAKHPAAATSKALVVVMEDFAQSEEDLNNDHRRGWEPGTTARNRHEEAMRWEQVRAERRALAERYRAEGHEPRVCELVERGYSLANALSRFEEEQTAKPETEAQQRARREKEERADQRYWDGIRRRSKKRDEHGYRAGQLAGDNVSLDRQIDERPMRKIGG